MLLKVKVKLGLGLGSAPPALRALGSAELWGNLGEAKGAPCLERVQSDGEAVLSLGSA